MSALLKPIRDWLKARNFREQVFLFFLGFIVIYLIWNVLLTRPLVARQHKIIIATQAQKTQRDLLNDQINAVLKIIKSNIFLNASSNQTHDLQQQISATAPLFISQQSLLKLNKSIIAQQASIALVSLRNFPDQVWTLPGGEKTAFYQHRLRLEFHGNYFKTIKYLSSLEKLPWHIYWDSLEYKVLEYPEANVAIEFHVLSDKKDA